MKQLYAPNGNLIIGTLEHVPGCAHVSGWELDAAGRLEPVWASETEMYWDDSKTQDIEGDTLVIDEDGETWPMSQCTVREDQEPSL
jgi:hypothetical protein